MENTSRKDAFKKNQTEERNCHKDIPTFQDTTSSSRRHCMKNTSNDSLVCFLQIICALLRTSKSWGRAVFSQERSNIPVLCRSAHEHTQAALPQETVLSQNIPVPIPLPAPTCFCLGVLLAKHITEGFPVYFMKGQSG